MPIFGRSKCDARELIYFFVRWLMSWECRCNPQSSNGMDKPCSFTSMLCVERLSNCRGQSLTSTPYARIWLGQSSECLSRSPKYSASFTMSKYGLPSLGLTHTVPTVAMGTSSMGLYSSLYGCTVTCLCGSSNNTKLEPATHVSAWLLSSQYR